jgi:hypothetical protein
LEGSFVPCAKAQVIEPDNATATVKQPNVNPVAIFNVQWSPGRDFTAQRGYQQRYIQRMTLKGRR